jgi:metal-responsive CopG/Arc/MetJ family transcriptional regulator
MSRMESMTTGRKVKISISLDADVLDAVDRRAAKEKSTRSAIMERWLRSASRQSEMHRLEEETAAYYDALTPGDKADDREWADFASRSARELTIDERERRRTVRPRRS